MEKLIAACIIENDKGELLLQKKTQDYPIYHGMWCLFGGAAESEDLHKEMNRELKEEIGIKPSIKFIFTMHIKVDKRESMMNVFLAKINDLSKIKLGEGAGYAFFGKEELRDLKIHPEASRVLNKYFKEFTKKRRN
jgi:ADP-ribose pyrophosphatase YjhB (NUDIX family)